MASCYFFFNDNKEKKSVANHDCLSPFKGTMLVVYNYN